MMHICSNTSPILPIIKAMVPQAFSMEAKVDLEVAKEVLGGHFRELLGEILKILQITHGQKVIDIR